MKKAAAYGVHLFTALGAGLGLWALILTYNGFYKETVWVLAVAAIIDSVDGALARLTQTKEHAPAIDGALMDNIVDFITWTIAPLLWIFATMNIPTWVLVICAIASIFGFSNTKAKTDDHFFLGFPSYWNIVVFYIFLLELPVTFASAVLLMFALVTFLPVKFVYPSRTKYLRPVTLILGSIFTLQLIALLYYFDQSPPWLIYSSFLFPFYYFGLSFFVNIKSPETSR
ncbi:CDP-alcohol phosphatidyltransferase family protein [Fodinibius sp.]|uniref:CDP-alcohol phosphatidyltransferase family protein n=1 Tax=Fodinibius sp. TaxID=1872440 RepID=UPI002ACD733B|nr:CDP-alcohol phosphatidyltransferase family protein [Fodinibius sp.]MDZ7660676.1 CDP-alcohol phosphatidyltransferase family protein [Fodinibius sp.]